MTAAKRSLFRRPLGLSAGVAFALATAFLLAPPTSQSRSLANLTLYVYFGYSNDIAVKLADGTAVGTQSGAPSVIPAGFYTVALEQPGCVQVPAFDLQGPGVDIVDNLSGGEVTSATESVTLLPNSTYTWRDDDNRSIVYTFETSSAVIGTPPPPSDTPAAGVLSGPPNSPSANTDLVGSALVPSRGTLIGSVTAAGKLTLAYHGRSVGNLKAGLYTIDVTDHSRTSGFMIETKTHRMLRLTGGAFIGTRSEAIDLSAGTWLFMSQTRTTPVSITVS
jgi:hypothetical protein